MINDLQHRNQLGTEFLRSAAIKAQVLARRLRQVTEEFLQHENRHRPGYLDEDDAPKIVP
ncbi:MAG: hypothetical protein ACTHLY_14375 [Pseudolabrys sp.]